MPTRLRVDDESAQRLEALARALRGGPKTADELITRLGISQPTFSRTIRDAGQNVLAFRVKGVRTPRYGLVRPVPSVAAQQNVYRIDTQGAVRPVGSVALLEGGSTLSRDGHGSRLFAGLPPSMAFAAPSGFLGRKIALVASKLIDVPPLIREWSDEHKAIYLFALGSHLPGDLVFSDTALEREMSARRTAPVIDARRKADAYRTMVDGLTTLAAGSSAGGEQPKFLCETEDHGHVIVKFARSGTRMADLLVLEQLALGSLADAGVAAASTELIQGTSLTFLEVRRFDRIGRFGRVGVISAGALDDEFFGRRDSWSAFADRCIETRLLSPDRVQVIHALAAYSELIGNTDAHFENISLLLDEQGSPARVSPAYDVLPMKYASLGGGLDPALRPIEPKLGAVGGRVEAWTVAARAARDFWARAGQDQRVSADMRALAATNLAVVEQFVEPLVGTPPKARSARNPRSATR